MSRWTSFNFKSKKRVATFFVEKLEMVQKSTENLKSTLKTYVFNKHLLKQLQFTKPPNAPFSNVSLASSLTSAVWRGNFRQLSIANFPRRKRLPRATFTRKRFPAPEGPLQRYCQHRKRTFYTEYWTLFAPFLYRGKSDANTELHIITSSFDSWAAARDGHRTFWNRTTRSGMHGRTRFGGGTEFKMENLF